MLTPYEQKYALTFAKMHGIVERKLLKIFYQALADSIMPVLSTLNPNNVRSDVWVTAYQKAYKLTTRFADYEYKQLKSQNSKSFISFLNDIFAGRMAAYGAAVGLKYSKDLTETTIEKIQKALSEAAQNYMTHTQTARLIAKYVVDKKRALLIARTETTTAANLAKQEGAKEYFKEIGEDIDTGYKMWISRMDGKERHDHEVANEQAVHSNEKFIVGDEEADAPGDPTLSASERVRCRCTHITMTAAGYRRRHARQNV